ncbi:MAG: hypothetical protein ACLFTT_11095 [Candidatus Hydrogenedentota bacterium]
MAPCRKLLFAWLVACPPLIVSSIVSAAEEDGLSSHAAQEYAVIAAQIGQFREAPHAVREKLRREVLEPAALVTETDRDPLDVILRRTQALLNDIRTMTNAPDLAMETAALRSSMVQGARDNLSDAARKELFAEVCAIRRRIAFSNPLLDFQDIVFLKHHRARYDHMVDQYFGFHAVPGGGVYVLEAAFSDTPRLRNVLEDTPVRAGRLAGQPLTDGAFISLDLDFDAETILFAWTEAAVPVEPTKRTPLEDLWKPESTYHVFSANIDGSHLEQLTDGVWNDFDPCWLPNGRIAFISERRGGFLRCGVRPDPTYTLHDIAPDGSDLRTLSFHETHEWHPSVNNDGQIVYSRWDYVDRDSDIAHHIWLCYPDGTDPRTAHGNYPEFRESRPWMELSIRAIPNSPKYVAVAAPHHGQNYGSLVLIDLRRPDDGAMSQLKRITPEVAFPESETAPGVPCPPHKGRNNGTSEVYGTPWPLSETYYLGVYDPGQKHYGLYLVDAFGNRVFLYRDPEIAALDPIPLRPRPRPPIIPPRSNPADKDAKGYVAVMNIYESDRDWPEDTQITGMRVIQLYPKTTPAQNEPKIGVGAQSLARGVIGTAPVEADGSVYCEVPVGAPIYFQALDEQGRAVQTMRSDTYVHPGETLSCVGCHESKHSAAAPPPDTIPLAMQRSPSTLTPEFEGANPLLFSKLVQPVLDRHCTPCHTEEPEAPGLRGGEFGEWGWSESYATLSQFAWAKHGGNGALSKNETSYSIPGEVGARASKLMPMLDAGHQGVALPEEDRRRISLWLDANSVFYGAYHETEKQARGETVWPALR